MAASGLILNPYRLEDFSSVATLPWTTSGSNLGTSEKPSQLFVAILGPCSSLVPFEVHGSDTIESFKLRLHAFQGFHRHRPRLVHAGHVLSQDHKLLHECGSRPGDILCLVFFLSDRLSITVKAVDGESYVFTIGRADSIRNLKNHISSNEGDLPPESEVLTLKGKYLEDSTVVQDLYVGGETVLCLVVQKPIKIRSPSVNRAESDVTFTARRLITQPRAVQHEVEGVSKVWNVNASSKFPLQVSADSVRHHSELRLSNFSIRCEVSEGLRDLVEQVRMGLSAGQAPVLVSEGSGGVYFMKDECGLHNLAVFKPMDEEPMAVNNPRGFSSTCCREGLKKGTRSGEGAIKEVAAFILDHPRTGPRDGANKGEGFAGVPATTMVRCYNHAFNYTVENHTVYRKAKVGSLQRFVHAIASCEDMGFALFAVDEVHKIAVLDVRLANTDRHGGNVLVSRHADGSLKLVPIDHGYCLPDKLEDCTFEWLYWPQAQQPFGADTMEYIDSLDAEQDLALLQRCGWVVRPQVAQVLRVTTMLLKKGVAAVLTAFEIGSIMCRVEDLQAKSPIELMLEEAESRRPKHGSERGLSELFAGVLDEYLMGRGQNLGSEGATPHSISKSIVQRFFKILKEQVLVYSFLKTVCLHTRGPCHARMSCVEISGIKQSMHFQCRISLFYLMH